MKRSIVCATAGALIVTACVQANDGQTTSFDGLAGSRTVDTDGNVEMNGAAVTLRGRAGGWVTMNGASVDVDARIGGDLEANGASVEVEGAVGGDSEVNGASVRLDGDFTGEVEVNAARARLDGRFTGPVVMNVGSARLFGDHAGPVTVAAGVEDSGWFGRSRGTVRISGHLAAGGSICAEEVIFERGSSVGGRIVVEADAAPELPAEIDANLVEFRDRRGARCR